MYCRFFNSDCLGILVILGDKLLAKLLYGYSLVICTLNHFIVNIRKVLNKGHIVPNIFKVSAHSIKHNKRPCISYMEIVINCRSARIHLYVFLVYWDKFFFLSCKSIINSHTATSFYIIYLFIISFCLQKNNCFYKKSKNILNKKCSCFCN